MAKYEKPATGKRRQGKWFREWSGDFKPGVSPAEKVTFERRAREVREPDGSLQVIEARWRPVWVGQRGRSRGVERRGQRRGRSIRRRSKPRGACRLLQGFCPLLSPVKPLMAWEQMPGRVSWRLTECEGGCVESRRQQDNGSGETRER